MSLIIATERYVSDSSMVIGGVYSVDDMVYIDKSTLLITNDVAESVSDIGTIGEIAEAPSAPDSGDRMVIRLSVVAEFETPLKDLLRSRDL
jgi:hypothetical protein